MFKELEKVKVARLPEYSLETKSMIIHKYKELVPKVGGYFKIKLNKCLTNPPEGFTLHDNWNRGIVPKSEILSVEITKVMGNMVKVNSDEWDGWLPLNLIEIIGEL